jgi:TonB-linked SusC/RagA family outer membrane protein
MRKFLTFLCVTLTLYGRVTAQEARTITGTVLDATGAPIAGASVTIKGTQIGTSTNNDGSFIIHANADAKTLVITAVNFAHLEVSIQGKNKIGTINLTAATKDLSEVVVVAYGTQKKTNITGSVATVTGAAVADKPFTSVDKELQGDVAGVQVSSTSGQPGSATDIRIRGIGSITASAAPLWVIDGVIAQTGDLTVNTTTANPLSTLNPDDIESISVLKDAASTAPYGSRGANGVIIVTTKKGKAGLTHFSVVGEFGGNSRAYNPSNKPENSLQLQTSLRQALTNNPNFLAQYGLTTSQADVDKFINLGFGYPANYTTMNTDWFNVASQKGPQTQVNVSMSGGNDKTTVYASTGIFDQQGISLSSDFQRINGAIAVTHKASDRFTLSASLNGSNTSQHTPTNGGTFANPVLASYFLLPWYTPRNPNGTLRYGASDSLGEFKVNGGLFNPLAVSKLNNNLSQQTALRGSASGELKILDGLKLTSRFSGEFLAVQEDQYRSGAYGDGFADGGDASSNYTRTFNYTWDNFVDWKQKTNKEGDMYFDLKAGLESFDGKFYTLQAAGHSFPQSASLQYLASTSTPTTAFALPQEQSTFSEFAIADYNIKDRYVLSASFRRDESSVFGASNRWGSFYSVGGTWNVNEENFMKQQELFSLLKLRGSYGQTGNSLGFGDYTAIAQFGTGFNYQGQPGIAQTNVGDPNLTWEKNNSGNVGVDFGMWRDRLTGTVEYYHRETVGLLTGVPFSYTAGIASQNENIGNVVNQGIEVTLGGRPVVTRDFVWSISFNIAHNANRVKSLFENKSIAAGNFNYTVGHDLQEYYLQQWAGVNPATGQAQWLIGGAGSSKNQITDSYDSAGLVLNKHADPTVYGGLSNTFTYKGFTLDIQFTYNFGNSIFDNWYNYLNSDGQYTGSFNQMTHQLSAWQKPGDKTDVPQLVFGDPSQSNLPSTRWLYNGNYIRLRNIQFSYNLPSAAIKRLHLSNLSLYIRGTNLLTFGVDKNLPYDPEAGINSTANLEVVIPKTVAGGIRIGF